MKKLLIFSLLLFSISLIVSCEKKYPENPTFSFHRKYFKKDPILGNGSPNYFVSFDAFEIGGIDSLPYEKPKVEAYGIELLTRKTGKDTYTRECYISSDFFINLGYDTLNCGILYLKWGVNKKETFMSFHGDIEILNCLKNSFPNYNFHFIEVLINVEKFKIIKKYKQTIHLLGNYRNKEVIIKMRLTPR